MKKCFILNLVLCNCIAFLFCSDVHSESIFKKEDFIERHLNGAGVIVDGWIKQLDRLEKSIDTYIPVDGIGMYDDRRIYMPYFFKMWGKSFPKVEFYLNSGKYMNDGSIEDVFRSYMGEYDVLYSYYYPWSGKYDFIVLRNGCVFLFTPYLKSDKGNEVFYSSGAWRSAMDERIKKLLMAVGDQEILFLLKEMKKIENPRWRFDIGKKDIAPEVYDKINRIMNRFRESRDSAPNDNFCFSSGIEADVALDIDPDIALYFFERYFINMGEADYRYYGVGSKIFGMSLLSIERFSTKDSWPRKLEMLFGELKVYVQNEKKDIQGIECLCSDILNEYVEGKQTK